MRRISLALALVGAVAATGCGKSSAPASTGGNRGIESQSFKLTVRGEKRYETGSGATLRVYMLPEGGLVTGNGINCGYNASGVAQTACEAQVAYGTPVALQIANFYGNNGALPPVSYGFYGFAGACTGSGTTTGATACAIDAMNADRLVLVRFAFTQAGLGAHGAYQDPAVHGLAFETKALTCTQCHGATLGGAGLAPACAGCHNGTLAYAITFPAVPSAPITKGGHFDPTKMAWTDDEGGGWSASCLRCHTGQGFLDYVGVDGSANYLTTTFATTSTLKSTTAACEAAGTCTAGAYAYGPLKCGTCHNSASEPSGAAGLKTIQFPSSNKNPAIPAVTTDNDTALCSQCHQGRESAWSLNAKIGTTDPDVLISPATSFVNPHYLGAAGTLFGSATQMWGEFPGNTYAGPFLHGGLNSCTYCHDAHDGQILIAKCGQCHTTATGAKVATLADLTASRQTGWTGDIDGDGNATESLQAELEGLEVTLYAALRAYATDVVGTSIVYDGAAHPYYFVDANGNGLRDGYVDGVAIPGFDPALADSTQYKKFTPRSLRAAFNYKWAHAEPGAWAHNARYAVQALYDSITELNLGLGANAVPFNGTARDSFAPAPIAALGGHFDATKAAWGDHGGWGAGCLRCHTSQGFQDYVGLDGSPNYTAGTFATTSTLTATTAACQAAGTCDPAAYKYGPLQCQTCHNAVSDPLGTGISTVYWFQATTPSAKFSTTDKTTALCAQCHQARESTSSINAKIAAKGVATADSTFGGSFMNPHYLGAAATVFGGEAQGWVEVATSTGSAAGTYYGSIYTGKNEHGGAGSCTACHDAHTGALPADGAGVSQIAGKCGICHFDEAGLPVTSLLGLGGLEEVRQFGFEGDVDGDGDFVESVKAEIDGVAAQLLTVMQAYAARLNTGGTITYTDNYPYYTVSPSATGWSPRLMRAAVNYKWVKADPGAWAHNPRFAVEVLFDSIADLKAGIVALGGTPPVTTAKRAFNGHFGGAEDASPYAALIYHYYEPFNAAGGSMGFTSAACYQCHGGKGGLDVFLGGAPFSPVGKVTLPDSAMANKVNAFQCSTCHALDGANMTGIRSDVANVYFPAQKASGKYVTVTASTFAAPADAVCATCHSGRENKVSVDDKIASVTIDPANAWTFSFINPHYLGAAGVLFGSDTAMLYQYGTNTYAPAAGGSCVGCHDPKATKHTFEVGPGNATDKDTIATLASQLYAEITAYSQSAAAAAAGGAPVCYNGASHPYWYLDNGAGGGTAGNGLCEAGEKNGAKLDAKALKATFNYKWAMAEPGAYAHNYAYIAQILIDSILDLNPSATLPITRP